MYVVQILQLFVDGLVPPAFQQFPKVIERGFRPHTRVAREPQLLLRKRNRQTGAPSCGRLVALARGRHCKIELVLI
jgi:hypothetical protein